MKSKNTPLYSLHPKQVFWVCLVVIIAVLPHFPRLPLWFPLMLILVVSFRWLTAKQKIKPLPPWLIAVLTVLIFLAIIYFQGFALNREISVTILTTMTVLKLLETWRKRDAWMVVILCYFVILTRFFYSQDMLLVLYLFASVFVTTHTLFVLQHCNDEHYLQKSELKQTGSLLAVGIPLAAVFFLFFPRLGSPIWGSPDLFGQGKTGMSDEMSPGSISQLFNDDSTAFRVTFSGDTPAKSSLYWRGPVLWDFDGKTWTRNNKQLFMNRPESFSQQGQPVSYEIELEPSGQHYLFSLDYVVSATKNSVLLPDSQLLSEDKINQLRHYSLDSVQKKYNPYELLSRKSLQRLKALPKNYNKKTLQMMQQWQQQNLSAEQLIQKALLLFAQDEFYYSYSPPLLQGDTVDQFLFETKSGFCEHYASAFTVMMRAAGLPARVVTGYQGGIINEDYWLIKQSDAHAWSEVWISGKGWLRVDPTAAVSPLRVEQGSQALMANNARHWLDSSWYRKLGERYDGMRYKWNQWVRDYNALKQKALFEVMGFDVDNGKSIALVLGVGMLVSTIIVLLFLYLTRPKRRSHPYDKIYKKFVNLLQQKEQTIHDSEGIIAFSKQAVLHYPQAKTSINEFSSLYLKLRYAKYNSRNKHLEMRLHKLLSAISAKIS